MKNEFIPYEQALELKELGFDEPCLGSWNFYTKELNYNGQPSTFSSEDVIQLPLYQQVFRWFREKYDIDFSINTIYSKYNENTLKQYSGVIDNKTMYINVGFYDNYEEAELECIKELIKIVKQQKMLNDGRTI